MEEKKNNNTLTTVVITILVILVLGLGGFIGYDKLINKTDNESNTTTESKECDCPEIVEEEKGKCPLTKFDASYTLTDADKEEIIDAIVANSTYYKREDITTDMLRNNPESNKEYYISVELAVDPDNIAPALYFISKVNGKFKVVLYGANGVLKSITDVMSSTLDGICS